MLVVVLAATAVTGCGQSPESARRELGSMGIKYTQDSFRESIENGDTLAVELFLTAGMNVNARRGGQISALETAISAESDEIVLMLLDAGAIPRENALARAIDLNSWELVDRLLDAGGKPTLELFQFFYLQLSDSLTGSDYLEGFNVNDYSRTLDEYVQFAQWGNVELLQDEFARERIIEFMRHGDAEVNSLLFPIGLDLMDEGEAQLGAEWLETAADMGAEPAEWLLEGVVERGNIQAAEILIDSGAKADKQSLIVATRNGDPVMMELLLDEDVSVTAEVLTSAAQSGNAAAMEVLLDEGAKPSRAVLIAAVEAGSYEIAELLMNEGVAPSGNALVAALGMSSVLDELTTAFSNSNFEAILSLRDSVITAVNSDDRQALLELLVEAGARPNKDVLLLAALGGSFEMVELLVEAGARPNTDALDAAAWGGSFEMVELLLEAGARPSSATLDVAAASRSFEVVELLLEAGAEPGDRAILLALNNRESDTSLIELLLEAGAIPSQEALRQAYRSGNPELVELLDAAQSR